ncbi:MAG: glycosyltransferase [Planctomycetes bacterium]|nr:glycosyltransferase [Planctomycetota bacterium]
MAARTLLFAGGGSGGHISPGLAIAERLVELDPTVRCVFACSERAIDAAMLSEAGVAYERMPASVFSARPLPLLRFLGNYRRTKRTAGELIERENVLDVISLGGFVSAPVVAAAKASGATVTLVNLDDPPGKANRWIARRCDRVLSAIELRGVGGFAHQRVGMPIRRNSVASCDQATCRERLGLDPAKRTLLVTGASQGAGSINRFVPHFAAGQPGAFAQWQVYHLAGRSSVDEVRRAYAEAKVSAVVESFQNCMGLAWGAADLALSRAGASSVAEAWANAVPTIFMPYPYHTDLHQRRNAEPMAALGGAIIETDRIEAARNVADVGPTLAALMEDVARRDAMRAALRSHKPADGAKEIAQIVLGPGGS